MRARRLVPAVVALALTAAAGRAPAQVGGVGGPSIGEALRTLEHLHALHRNGGDPWRQTFVYPERPGQNQVAWYDFDWRYQDLASPSGGEAGLRLYYYGRERAVAERALPVIRNAYLRLVDLFHYTPRRTIPYVLYASQREFQATNVFQVGEGVLGVTSPRDLKMTLPYFGNHELFREVSTHELVHQFTIQKLMDLSGEDGSGGAIDALPLWFVEGIAEYYARGGLDPGSELFLRDVVWNPDPERHYEVVSFDDDRHRGYVPTYKLGQARVAFVAETYGRERVQGFLEGAAWAAALRAGFPELVRHVLGEPLEEVDRRWRAWLRQRTYPPYLRARQDLTMVREVAGAPDEVEDFTVGPDGQLVLYRGLDREAGRARVYLMDARSPSEAVEVAADGQPGVESLHPVERAVLALGRGQLAFAAQDGPGDALYLVPFAHQPPAAGRPARLELGERRRLPLSAPGGETFLEVSDPAFSPDGRRLAFVGLTGRGQLDVYVVPVEGGEARALTDDLYAERDLAWGADGIWYASDATDHGRFNLFRLDPATGARTRVTTGPGDDGHPCPQPDGSVLFDSTAGGKPDLFLLRGGEVHRLSDLTAGLSSPATAPGARGLWASAFHGGRFRLVELPRAAWLAEGGAPVAEASGAPLPLPELALPAEAPRYDPWRWSSWRPEAGIVYGGAGAGGVAGRAAALFADTLRDRLVYLDLTVLGSFDLTQGVALFQDRSGRDPWSVGVYHWVWSTVDPADARLSYYQRDFGALGVLTFPVDRFQRFELEGSAGGVQRYCLTDFNVDLAIACQNGPLSTAAGPAWEARNGGVNPRLGVAGRWGYDDLRYDPSTGPLAGRSLLLELGADLLPVRGALSGYARLDAQRFWQLIGRLKFSLRAAAGGSFGVGEEGRNWQRTWWVSAADNLRGYSPLDLAYVVGTRYYVANAEVSFPLDPLLHLFIFQYLEGVLALDFGGVFDRFSGTGADPRDPATSPSDLGPWEARTLTGALGVNFILGPLLLRLSFGHPFDIGGVRTPALRDGDSWVTNLSLRYLFL